jgi:hypothetical protein
MLLADDHQNCPGIRRESQVGENPFWEGNSKHPFGKNSRYQHSTSSEPRSKLRGGGGRSRTRTRTRTIRKLQAPEKLQTPNLNLQAAKLGAFALRS